MSKSAQEGLPNGKVSTPLSPLSSLVDYVMGHGVLKALDLEFVDDGDGDGRWRIKNGYQGFVDSFPVEQLATVTTGSYQGDTHWLLARQFADPTGDIQLFAVLTIGYGSCSGCDMLESMEYTRGTDPGDYEVDQISLWNGIIWKSADEILRWLRADARTHDVYQFADDDEFDDSAWGKFIAEAIDKVKQRAGYAP